MNPDDNYAPLLLLLAEQMAEPGSVVRVEIRHDDDCSHWKDGRCDCEPEVVGREVDPERAEP